MESTEESAETVATSATDRHPVQDRGEFPFPLLDEGRESRQLVWIRNHANYMAPDGMLDYVRVVSIIVRGVLVNLLIAMPYLLVMGLAVAVLSVRNWRKDLCARTHSRSCCACAPKRCLNK